MRNDLDNHNALIERLIGIAPGLHGAGTFSAQVLRVLARYCTENGKIKFSVETGSGASTLLFSNLSEDHVAFTIDSGTGSLENVKISEFFRAENVTIVEGPSQLTVPRYHFSKPIQIALIDGPHAYPFPDLEYFYFYPYIEAGGILILDDIHIKTIHNLLDFLSVDDMWKLEEVVETTAFLRRTNAETFPPTGDGWWLQNYNEL
jgi:hypothetical protein